MPYSMRTSSKLVIAAFGMFVALMASAPSQAQEPQRLNYRSLPPDAVCDFRKVKKARKADNEARQGDRMVSRQPGAARSLPLNWVSITDHKITNKIVTQDVGGKREETGALGIWARFVNCTDYSLVVEARTHFLRNDGSPAETIPTPWQKVMLSPHAFNVYKTMSMPFANADKFLVEVREGR